jgi:hypothetical protein
MIDFSMYLSLTTIGGQVANMTTPTVRLKRRHHQPLERRFEEECHLLWRLCLERAHNTSKLRGVNRSSSDAASVGLDTVSDGSLPYTTFALLLERSSATSS